MAQEKVVDLMAALERSVAEAKAARLRRESEPRCSICLDTCWVCEVHQGPWNLPGGDCCPGPGMPCPTGCAFESVGSTS